MLSVPDGLRDDPVRPSVHAHGVTVVDYTTDRSTIGVQVVVSRPTLVFLHEGVKELTSAQSDLILTAHPGQVVAMRAGMHVLSDLLTGSSHYRSTIVSVDLDALSATVGAVEHPSEAGPAAVAEVPDQVHEVALGLRRRLTESLDEVEGRLAVKELLVPVLLQERLRGVLLADLKVWKAQPATRVREVMNRHCLTPLTVPQYAALCAMSVSTFHRVFHEVHGTSPGRWLVETRLTYAARLLETDDRPVTEVCAASGYGDLSHFIRSFKARHGLPPAAYRASRRAGTVAPPAVEPARLSEPRR